MRPFTIYHSIGASFPGQQEKLVELIREVTEPDCIFLLGASLYQRRSESIFCPCAPAARHASDYFLLILISKLADWKLYELQDKIENHCKNFGTVITIVLETNTFNDWLKAGHRFARTVLESSIQPYASDIFSFPAPGDFDPEIELKAMEKYYAEGLNKMREFLAGADLFRVREQNKMTAFMLHQAAEHGLRAILKTGTGYHCITHSIERLLRYSSMVSHTLPEIFSGKTEKDKRLFRLLQNAYSDARYKDDYAIHANDLLALTEKIRHIQEILERVGRTYIYTQQHKHL